MDDVMWIPSWYPSVHSTQNGDFIERHAKAAANYINIVLIHIQSSDKVETKISRYSRIGTNLLEIETIFPSVNCFRVLNFIRYLIYFNKNFKKIYRNNKKPSLVHVHVSYKAGLIALWLKFRYNIPYIITEHWSYFNLENVNNFSKSNFINKWLFKYIFNNSDFVIPVSDNLNRQLKKFFPKISTATIPNVVDNKLFFYKEFRDKRRFRFTHVSSMVNLKNPDGILNAFVLLQKKYSFIELKFIGPPTKNIIEILEMNDFFKGSVECMGKVNHHIVALELQLSNAFVLFSQFENLPCVIAESLCCGVPVISSAVGGVPEMIDESNGILVPPGDENALYNAMEAMILNYKKYDRRKISARAQAKYNPDVVGKQIIEVYERVLAKK